MSQLEEYLDSSQIEQQSTHKEDLESHVQRDEKIVKATIKNLGSIVQNSPDFIALVDRDLTIDYLNRSVPDLDPKEMVGRNLLDFILPEFHDLVRKRNDAVFATGEGTQFEITGIGPDGTIAWYASRLGPVLIDGRVVSVVHTSRDITKRKLAEEALRESEMKLRSLLNALPDTILRFHKDGTCLEFRPARGGGRAGLPRDAVGKKLTEILPDSAVDQGLICFASAFDEDRPQQFEYQYEHRYSKVVRDYEARFVTSSDDEALVIIHDTTQRRQAERAALTTESRFRQLMDRAPVCIVHVDLTTSPPIILSANRRTETVYGIPLDRLRSRQLSQLFATENIADLTEMVAKVALGETATMESRHLRADGTRFPVRISVAPEAETGIERMIFTVQDITAEWQRRSEIEGLDQERRRIAHEIHDGLAQDLSALRLRSTLWHEMLDENPSQMHSELDELSAMLKTCISEVRRSIFALRPVVLDDLGFVPAIQQLLVSFGNLYSLQPLLNIDGPAERLSPQFELPLFRVIQESLNNIGQHADATTVSITLNLLGTEDITLTVVDNGIGVQQEPEHQALMDGRVGVQGMRERIESLGGSFSIESEADQGTRVRVVLPAGIR